MIMVLLLVGCGSKTEKSSFGKEGSGSQKKELYEYGMEAVTLLGEMAHSQDYMEMMGIRNSLSESAEMNILRLGDYSNPVQIYELSFEGDVTSLLALSGVTIPDSLKEMVGKRYFSNFASTIIANYGSDRLALFSLFRASYLFADASKEPGNHVLLYCYDKGYPVEVSFSYGDNGAILAEATFFMVDDLDTSSVEALQNAIQTLVPLPLKVTQIK